MDAYTFVNNLFGSGNLKAAPPPPGNASPSYNYVNPLNPTKTQVINSNGQSSQEPANSTWRGWLGITQNILTAPLRLTESALRVSEEAGDRASSMVRSAAGSAVNAVTGIGGFMKWIVVGLVAFAVLYGLFLVAPFIKAASAPLRGRD